MARKNRLFAKLANNVDDTGGINLNGLGASATSAIDAAGTAIYDSAGLLPSSGMSAGDQAWSGNRLYISNGSGWYNIALVNADPRFVSITDSDGGTTPFALATDGVTPVTITLVGADSDGVGVTYSYTKDAGFDGLATITGSGTEYTVTPLSEDSATTSSGTVTFKVSDGISFGTSVNTFTLTFAALTLNWNIADISYTDVTTNSGYYHLGTLGVGLKNVELVGDYLYYCVQDTVNSYGFIEIFDISSGTPVYDSSIGGGANSAWSNGNYGIRKIGDRLYGSGGSGSFFAIDVSDPANPSIHRADKYQTGGITGGYTMYSPIIDVANENIYYRKANSYTDVIKSSLSDYWTNGGNFTETTVFTGFRMDHGDINADGSLLVAFDLNNALYRIYNLSTNTQEATISANAQGFGGAWFLDNTTVALMGQNNQFGFKIYDLTTPSSPSLLHSNTTVSRIGGTSEDFYYDAGANRLIVTLGNYGFNIWDTSSGFSNPSIYSSEGLWQTHGYSVNAKNGYTYTSYSSTIRTFYNA